jgi:hypothetical protein
MATIDASTGENTSPIIFSDSWTGTADFDTTAPTGSVTAVKVTRPHTSCGRWRARVFFSARDNVDANPVRFNATATAGTFYMYRSGRLTGGTGSFTLAFHPAKRAHRLRISIELSDPWSNTRTITKNVRLRW